jgi:hypothetical protein
MTANEVITLDNQQWISVHVYVMKDCCRFPILLTLECVEMNAIAHNITSIFLKCMVKHRGVSVEELISWWVCLGCDEDFFVPRTLD